LTLIDLLAHVGEIANLPLNVILLVAVVFLWRKLEETQRKFEECLKDNREAVMRISQMVDNLHAQFVTHVSTDNRLSRD
jgi:glutaredoxin 2